MTEVLIVGANRGIGLEMCRQLVERGERVIAACRRSSDELDGLSGVSVHTGVDVSDRQALGALARELSENSLDWLVVVAGIMERVSLEEFDVDSVRRQFEINAIGPIEVTRAMLPCLRSGSKVGLVTSRMGSIADNTSGGSYGYRMSKAALNMAGRCLAHDLSDRKIAVRLLHPGFVRTDMTGGTGDLDAAESAAGLIARLEELTLEDSGRFFHQNGEELPW